MNKKVIFKALGIKDAQITDGTLGVYSPIDGAKIASVKISTKKEVEAAIARSAAAFTVWRDVPAPRRGALVRHLGDVLREKKEALGALVTLECGKILTEGTGEVQEMIDICDFAVGLSRQLYGLTLPSERPGHSMREYWHPIGPVGVISAFNFPVAVWAWNAALALVCGDPVIWKPSEKTPLTALACATLFEEACKRYKAEGNGTPPKGLLEVLIGKADVGDILVSSPRVPVISATGSTAMGRIVGPKVAARFGRAILELGGNNGIIVAPSANLDLAFQAILFGAVGTCGQRCTSTRRLFVHADVYDALIPRLKRAYGALPIGNPMESKTLIGPLIDKAAFKGMEAALKKAKEDGGIVTGGGRALAAKYPDAYYVHPALVEMPQRGANVAEETFAPILYIFKYSNFSDALTRHNAVPQGLSSAIFTNDVKEAEMFVSAAGSDCGIVNVNIGTSGAEIGGAFGGEKETGGGRESGSDSWKGYMRRVTSTVNYSSALPLAQNVRFDVRD